MLENPFSSFNFQKIWLKYFKPSRKVHSFGSIKQMKFYKDKYFPLYVNIGKNITNGMIYSLDETIDDFKGKVFLVYDVPQYFNVNNKNTSRLKVRKSRQYKGFAADLTNFNSFDEFFEYKYKSKTRNNYRKNLKRLESVFNVEYKFYHGFISTEEYDRIFNSMVKIIERRFGSLGLHNNILAKKEYYRELAYKMILDKKAVFSVIYCNEEPMSISLSFLSKKVLFYSITTFDIDYFRYNIGHTSIMKLMNWCFDNNIKIFDFSKGEYDYKKRWSNLEYEFECHVIYDSKNIISGILSSLVYAFFVLKQKLRDIKINYLFSKIKFAIGGSNSTSKKNELEININKITSSELDFNNLQEVNFKDLKYNGFRATFYNYLYSNPMKLINFSFYRDNEKANTYYAKSGDLELIIYTGDQI